MPQIVNFNNRQVIEPGAYAQVKSGISSPAALGTYGNVMVIDTGSGNGFGWGSGINGEISNGAKSIYEFNSLEDMKRAMRGGLLFDLMDYLWSPSNNGNGPNKVYYGRAATTLAPKFTLLLGTTVVATPETRATTGNLTVPSVPANGTVVKVYVDDAEIASFTKTASESTVDLLATAVAGAVNAGTATHGYSAVATTDDIVLTAAVGTGATPNGLVAVMRQMLPTPLNATSPFSGGVTAIYTSLQGSIPIYARSEGAGGNGVVVGGVLTRGYGFKLKAGIVDTNALIIEFYEGQYRGKDAAGLEYDVPENAVSNFTLCRSTEFTTAAELLAWMASDFNFNSYFFVPETKVSSTTELVGATELADKGTAIIPLVGGTTVYNALDVDSLLSSIEDLDNSMFLCDDYGPIPNPALGTSQIQAGANKGAMSVANGKILAYILNTSTFTEKAMYVGGGYDANKFNVSGGTADGSIQIAKYYDSPYTVVVHSGIKVPAVGVVNGQAYKFLPSLYHAALVCGRAAGYEPQVPITYKNLRITGVLHELKKSERELALQCGVLHTRYQSQLGWIINQGINSLQLNSNLVTSDGKSPEIQIMRIIHQINKELVMNATTRFVGGNLNTASAEDVKVFVEGYLTDRTASRLEDNLIITFKQVKVVLEQDYWKVTYCFVPNSPINRVFFTGFILDPKIEL